MKVILSTPYWPNSMTPRNYYRIHASPNVAAAFIAEVESTIESLRNYPKGGAPISQHLRKLPLQNSHIL